MILRIISNLLHVANSYPDAVDREVFYQMKTEILSRFGNPDGFDIQYFKGKKCWTCDGTGTYGSYYHSGQMFNEACYRCFKGWYKRPVWVVLDRYHLGRFVFHQPAERLFEEPASVPSQTKIIDGYVIHADHGWRKPRFAFFFLALLFDRPFLIFHVSKSCKRRWELSRLRLWLVGDNDVPF